MAKTFALPVVESVVRRIFVVRGQKVMLDSDLAELYGVQTKALVQAVKRNAERFPADFMFRLTPSEWASLRSQFVTSKGRGGRRHPPHAFSEHGALMLSSVLHSNQAAEISILVVRAFVWLRQMIPAHQELAVRLTGLETRLAEHDQALAGIIEAIRQLVIPPEKEKRGIGF